MAKDSDGKVTAPPYIAFQTLKTLFQNLKNDGVPSRIDRTMLKSFSGQVGSQLMTALKFLGLTDADGRTTPLLEQMVNAYGGEMWNIDLGDLLREAYAPMFKLNLEKATPGEFSEHFAKSFEGDGDTLRKAMTFFTNALRESGTPVSAYILKNKKTRTAGPKKRPAKSQSKKRRTNDEFVDDETGDTLLLRNDKPSERLLDLLDPSQMKEPELSAVWTLIKYFKAKGE